mmetsp:Transcript_22314/g.49394  ORF Transcript_22314/g.49394 Transcript_22314/m.49394 type:complete len:240 (-) Transcript_22314:78-797(-)
MRPTAQHSHPRGAPSASPQVVDDHVRMPKVAQDRLGGNPLLDNETGKTNLGLKPVHGLLIADFVREQYLVQTRSRCSPGQGLNEGVHQGLVPNDVGGKNHVEGPEAAALRQSCPVQGLVGRSAPHCRYVAFVALDVGPRSSGLLLTNVRQNYLLAHQGKAKPSNARARAQLQAAQTRPARGGCRNVALQVLCKHKASIPDSKPCSETILLVHPIWRVIVEQQRATADGEITLKLVLQEQ